MLSTSDCYEIKYFILPLLKHACGGKQLAAMMAIKRFAGVALEVTLRECLSCTSSSSVNKAFHSDFEAQRRHHHKSKSVVSVAPQKRTYVLQKLNKNRFRN